VRKAELRALGDDPAALPGCFDLRDLKRPGRTA